jgi:hypothetical protein
MRLVNEGVKIANRTATGTIRVTTNYTVFYVYGSVHRWSILILVIVERHATQSSLFIILQVHSTCFGCQRPSNVANWTRWREVAAQKIWPVPEAVVTVLCTLWVWLTPETCRVNLQNNRLLCVASRWIIFNINYSVFLPRVIYNQDAVFDVDWCFIRLEYFRYLSDISLHIMWHLHVWTQCF